MPSCLGIYIEKNIIKYAKLSKEKESIKVDAFGLKFYDRDRLEEAIEQIMTETGSNGVPISVNVSNETYHYFNILSILKGKDVENVVKTEFESYCFENKVPPNLYENKYTLVNSLEEKGKVRVINVAASKMDLSSKIQSLNKFRLTTLTPISMTIKNIMELQEKENSLIVNIEDKTTVTTLMNQKIYDVTVFEDGMEEVLEFIEKRENSLSKAYEICKGTTISINPELETETNNSTYLEVIMNTMYNIAGHVKKIINESHAKIDKIYLTGTAATINNIDLFFQDYLALMSCEIIKPYFIKTLMKGVNIKDYIEVNTAISLALQGLNMGIEGMNFKKNEFKDVLKNSINITMPKPHIAKSKISKTKAEKVIDETKQKKNKENMEKMQNAIKINWASEFTLVATVVKIILAVGVYLAVIITISNITFEKQAEVDALISKTNKEIREIQTDAQKIKDKKTEYERLITELENINSTADEITSRRNSIPDLLYKITNAIPKEVQITSIKNTSDTKIVITTQTKTYDHIGMFIAKLKNDEILVNVIASSGVQSGGVIKVTIEGELP